MDLSSEALSSRVYRSRVLPAHTISFEASEADLQSMVVNNFPSIVAVHYGF